jgi:hypothetical protein
MQRYANVLEKQNISLIFFENLEILTRMFIFASKFLTSMLNKWKK